MVKKEPLPRLEDIQPNRPEPITAAIDVIPYKKRMSPNDAVNDIVDGHYILIMDFYSSGLKVMKALKEYVKKIHPDQSFEGQREFRSVFRKLSHRVLLMVNNHALTVKRAPEIGWLYRLYPELEEFLLPFSQVQGLNSSWQWYEKGISIPTLPHKIYPFFGTYFPTRFEHLSLFEQWLKQYQGEKKTAVDIGIGCGVLSFQMLNHGFEKIYGTDINPNAIIGVGETCKANQFSSRVDLSFADLFDGNLPKSELIVFNPPWLPSPDDSKGIDMAIYYDKNLFTRFFREAEKHLTPQGKVVLLFSNLGQVSQLCEHHPIQAEIDKGGRFEQVSLLQKKVLKASKKTKRNQHWRSTERVELWVLKLKAKK